tara:strand:+ start:505 stop:831 length:327 start_codon:yes stop_codon:yes gene_type:complete
VKKNDREADGHGSDFSDTPMFTGVRQTSRDALNHLMETGQLGKQEAGIIVWLKTCEGSATLQEISEGLDMGINAVSGRVNELKKKGLIKEFPKRECLVTGRKVIPVGI